MKKLFEGQYAKHGNKAIFMQRKYVGLRSICSSSSGPKKDLWDSYICGCNSDGGCDACDD